MQSKTETHTEDAIDLDLIVEELCADFDHDAYKLNDAETAQDRVRWHNDIKDCWRALIIHAHEVEECCWSFAGPPPSLARMHWLFKRKNSPLKNCATEDFREILIKHIEGSHGYKRQFLTIALAVLVQGAHAWTWDECEGADDE